MHDFAIQVVLDLDLSDNQSLNIMVGLEQGFYGL